MGKTSQDTFVVSSSGLDWLRFTVPNKSPASPVIRKIVQARQQKLKSAGCIAQSGKWFDYRGNTVDTVFLGRDADAMLVQVSGAEANAVFQEVREYGEYIAAKRIDFEVTERYVRDNPKRATQLHKKIRLKEQKAGLDRQTALRLCEGRRYADTLYIGDRTSDLFARFYDKSREAALPPPGFHWRNEVECKDDRARDMWHLLCEERDERAVAQKVVKWKYVRHGIDKPWFDKVPDITLPSQRKPTDDERSLAWLQNYVRSTVDRLVANGRQDEVYEALGLKPPMR